VEAAKVHEKSAHLSTLSMHKTRGNLLGSKLLFSKGARKVVAWQVPLKQAQNSKNVECEFLVKGDRPQRFRHIIYVLRTRIVLELNHERLKKACQQFC